MNFVRIILWAVGCAAMGWQLGKAVTYYSAESFIMSILHLVGVIVVYVLTDAIDSLSYRLEDLFNDQ